MNWCHSSYYDSVTLTLWTPYSSGLILFLVSNQPTYFTHLLCSGLYVLMNYFFSFFKIQLNLILWVQSREAFMNIRHLILLVAGSTLRSNNKKKRNLDILKKSWYVWMIKIIFQMFYFLNSHGSGILTIDDSCVKCIIYAISNKARKRKTEVSIYRMYTFKRFIS